MYYYFFCDYKAVLKISGAYFGRIDGAVKGLNVEGEVLAEVCSLSGGENYNFIIDKDFIENPPQNVAVTDLKGGYLFRFYGIYAKTPFKIITQKRLDFAHVTVFSDGGLKLSLETPDGVIAESFNFYDENAEVYSYLSPAGRFVIIHFITKRKIFVYSANGQPQKIADIYADEFYCNDELMTVSNKKDIAKHSVKTIWEIKDGALAVKEKNITTSPEYSPSQIPEALIPYAFTEGLSVGEDFSFFLSEKIKKNVDKIPAYLGDFLSVMPPPPFRNQKEIGLIYKVGQNKYSVDYLTVEIVDGKIDNLKRSAT